MPAVHLMSVLVKDFIVWMVNVPLFNYLSPFFLATRSKLEVIGIHRLTAHMAEALVVTIMVIGTHSILLLISSSRTYLSVNNTTLSGGIVLRKECSR